MLQRCAPLIIGAMFVLAQEGNAAEVDFCPATVAHITAFHAPPDNKSAAYADSLFGITLQAQHPRSVIARLILASGSETYSASVPQVALKAVKRLFLAAGHTIDKTLYESAPVFIRFDRSRPLRYAWVEQASIGGEKPVRCPTQPASNDRSGAGQPFTTSTLDSRSDASIRNSLPSKDNTVVAEYTGQLIPPTCSQANHEARALTRIPPEFREIPRQQGLRGTAVVKIDLDSSGKAVGSSIYIESGSPLLDAAALSAAAANAYAPATFMCVPIVGSYLFVVDFR